MITVYLIRHGAKNPGSGDPGLSPAGKAEAQATGEYLHDRPIQRIYSSPLQRARETAALIGARHRLDVILDGRLRERANWGDLPGQSFEEFQAMWERCNQDRTYVPPVGDSSQQAGERVEAFIKDVYQHLRHGEIAAVGHGGVIVDFLLNVFAPALIERLNPSYRHLRNCSITTVVYDGGRYELRALAQQLIWLI